MAQQKFDQELNLDMYNVKTPAEFDSATGKWIMRMSNIMELYGKSTDVKPTTGIKIGTTFLEVDTKKVFIFDGASWGAF